MYCHELKLLIEPRHYCALIVQNFAQETSRDDFHDLILESSMIFLEPMFIYTNINSPNGDKNKKWSLGQFYGLSLQQELI